MHIKWLINAARNKYSYWWNSVKKPSSLHQWLSRDLQTNDTAVQRKLQSSSLSEGHEHLTEIIEKHRKGTCSMKVQFKMYCIFLPHNTAKCFNTLIFCKLRTELTSEKIQTYKISFLKVLWAFSFFLSLQINQNRKPQETSAYCWSTDWITSKTQPASPLYQTKVSLVGFISVWTFGNTCLCLLYPYSAQSGFFHPC